LSGRPRSKPAGSASQPAHAEFLLAVRSAGARLLVGSGQQGVRPAQVAFAAFHLWQAPGGAEGRRRWEQAAESFGLHLLEDHPAGLAA
jgi:hypothetical protein